ncbi:magnesium transporter CorA family protein [Luteococcus sp. H138]|uniref:magnesium transporter CorA family protein n=1 Tax=unclassified Luteococcus TaxID=2639923 RepID=UPI00313C8C4E
MGLRSRLWQDGRLLAEDFDLDRLDEHLATDGALVWLDLCMAGGTNAGDLQRLADELQLDAHAVEDAVAPGERPKASRHANHTFVSVYATDLQARERGHDSRLVTSRISAFVLPRGLVTVRRDDRFDLDQVVDQWDQDPDLLVAGVGALLHGLLDAVVDGHFETIQRLDDAIEELEDVLFAETPQIQQVQRSSYQLRKELVQLRRVVLPMREVVASLMRPGEKVLPHHNGLDGYFEDLYDHCLRAAEWTESLRDMIGSVFETNLSLQDARLNTIMKKLAGWAAVIAVPTAVTGWFGQNVPYPGFATAFGLWQSVVLMVLGTVGLYVMLKKRDWI